MCTVNIGPVTRIDPLEPAPPHAAHFLIIPDPPVFSVRQKTQNGLLSALSWVFLLASCACTPSNAPRKVSSP